MDARQLFAQECSFVTGATNRDNLPYPTLPEVAFVGRSNVGKSSLINALVNRNHLARISNTPGRTQEINFFSLSDYLMLVDLPGYGFARAPKKKVKGWTDLIYEYLKGRPNLARVCLLIDSRHGLKETDHKVMEVMNDMAVSFQIILTKIDKISAVQLAEVHSNIMALAPKNTAMHPIIINTSSRDRLGIPELQSELAAFSKAPLS